MIFQLSDWFPKPMIWAIIVKFDQIWKNWWRISCAEILEVGKNFFGASSVKKMSRFEEVSPEEIKTIVWKFTKTVILLGLAGNELIITNSAYGLVGYIQYISSYPARPRRITVNYMSNKTETDFMKENKDDFVQKTESLAPQNVLKTKEFLNLKYILLLWSQQTLSEFT